MRVCVMHFKNREQRCLRIERDFDFETGGRGNAIAGAPRQSPAEKASKRKRAADKVSGIC